MSVPDTKTDTKNLKPATTTLINKVSELNNQSSKSKKLKQHFRRFESLPLPTEKPCLIGRARSQDPQERRTTDKISKLDRHDRARPNRLSMGTGYDRARAGRARSCHFSCVPVVPARKWHDRVNHCLQTCVVFATLHVDGTRTGGGCDV
jgi:hypothetical protein